MSAELASAPEMTPATVQMLKCARTEDWVGYFAAYRDRQAERVEAAAEAAPRPEPEITTQNPWPEDFAVPRAAGTMLKRMEAAGWETRSGYSRAFRSGVGRGEWNRCHYVTVAARKGRQAVSVTWYAHADRGPKLSWSFDQAKINGWSADKIGMVVDALSAA